MEDVGRHWVTLCDDIGTSNQIRDDWWAIITRRYGEEWRHYHTLQHLQHLLGLFYQWKEFVIDLDTMRLAIFFHDIVYDPMANNNESQSVGLFHKFAIGAHLSQETLNRVSDMINATSTHSSPDCKDLDLCLFLDFDLAILGSEPDDYAQYASNVRKEYDFLIDASFCEGRKKVLWSLMALQHIYASEVLRDVYETQARRNMHNEIDSLSSLSTNCDSKTLSNVDKDS